MRSKLSRVIENVPKVYAAGKASMVDESKLIPTNVVGTSISLNDVSKLPHDVSCKVESLNLFQPTLKSQTLRGVTITRNDDNSYTLNGTVGDIPYSTYENYAFGTYVIGNETQLYVSGGTTEIPLLIILVKGNSVQTSVVNTGGVTVISADSFDCFNIAVRFGEGETMNGVIKPMVSLYDHSTYTPYISSFEGVKVIKYGADESEGYQELTSNADGTVEGMKSTSPYMNIKADTDGVVLNVTYNKSWGMQTEYDRFWDAVQSNGNRNNYNYFFTGKSWRSGTFNPKYPINCTYASSLFNNSAIVDTVVPITISGSNTSVFYNASSLVTIRSLDMSGATGTAADWFTGCSKLESITFEGVIPINANFKNSPLDAKSLVNIVEHLSPSVSGKTMTLNSDSVANADWSTTNYASWDELVATKKPSGWSISLVTG